MYNNKNKCTTRWWHTHKYKPHTCKPFMLITTSCAALSYASVSWNNILWWNERKNDNSRDSVYRFKCNLFQFTSSSCVSSPSRLFSTFYSTYLTQNAFVETQIETHFLCIWLIGMTMNCVLWRIFLFFFCIKHGSQEIYRCPQPQENV